MEQLRHYAVALVALIFCTAAAAHDEGRPRLLTVSGEGEVEVAPDRADVGFSVVATEKALASAEKLVTDGTVRLLALCESLGIPKSAIRSAHLVVQPQYDDGIVGGRQRIVGYYVSRQVDVDLRDLSKLGKLLQGAVEAGANNLSGVSFGSTRKDEHQRAALALAAQDARANADRLASTMGVKLGKLHALTAAESGGAPQPMMFEQRFRSKAAMSAPMPEQTYEAGQIKFQASVTAEFDLP
jgi:hypothetical protein